MNVSSTVTYNSTRSHFKTYSCFFFLCCGLLLIIQNRNKHGMRQTKHSLFHYLFYNHYYHFILYRPNASWWCDDANVSGWTRSISLSLSPSLCFRMAGLCARCKSLGPLCSLISRVVVAAVCGLQQKSHELILIISPLCRSARFAHHILVRPRLNTEHEQRN